MNPKVVQVSLSIGTTGLACSGFLEIPDGVDMQELQRRIEGLNRYSGDSHISYTRYNFTIVDRPAPPPAPEPPASEPAPVAKTEKKFQRAESAAKGQKTKAANKKAAAKKPAKKNAKKQGDLL